MRERKGIRVLSRLPLGWKLTIGSAFFIFVLFLAYTGAQYAFVESWMVAKEKERTRYKMNGILNGLLEKEAGFTEDELPRLRTYLDTKNGSDERIRIIDSQGQTILSVSDGVSEEWIAPVPARKTELFVADDSGHPLLVMKSPLTINSFQGTVEIVKNMDQFKQLTEAVLRLLLFTVLGAVALSGLGGWLMSRQLLKPLQIMAQTMRDVGRKGLQERIAVPQAKDEISTLMQLFNGMMDQVEESFRRQSQFVEDASHELRTPIAIMDGHLSLLLRWGKDDPAALEESLNISYHELSRLKALVEDLLMITRAEQEGRGETERTSRADRAVLELIGKWEELHPGYTFETQLTALRPVELAVPQRHLEQVVTILLDNAVKYSEPGSPVLVRASVSGSEAFFEVSDRGIGITEQDLPFVTERFYRVDKARSRAGGGTGLGLAIAKRLAEGSGGSLSIRSKESEGTTVTVSFPCSSNSEKREVAST